MPLVSDTLYALCGTKYFSTLDLKSGYWQVEMHPESREKTAFVTHNGLYEFNVIPIPALAFSAICNFYFTSMLVQVA